MQKSISTPPEFLGTPSKRILCRLKLAFRVLTSKKMFVVTDNKFFALGITHENVSIQCKQITKVVDNFVQEEKDHDRAIKQLFELN